MTTGLPDTLAPAVHTPHASTSMTLIAHHIALDLITPAKILSTNTVPTFLTPWLIKQTLTATMMPHPFPGQPEIPSTPKPWPIQRYLLHCQSLSPVSLSYQQTLRCLAPRALPTQAPAPWTQAHSNQHSRVQLQHCLNPVQLADVPRLPITYNKTVLMKIHGRSQSRTLNNVSMPLPTSDTHSDQR